MKPNIDLSNIHVGFKKSDGTVIEDLEKYIYDISSSHKAQLAGNNFKICIGTDSLFSPKGRYWSATYMSTIAFSYGNSGVHLIFRKDVMKGEWNNKLDLYTRLWKEVEVCAELAKWFRDTVNILPEVHLDINPNEKYQSNVLFNAAKGYIEGIGFSVQLKPDASIASCAADHFLHV